MNKKLKTLNSPVQSLFHIQQNIPYTFTSPLNALIDGFIEFE